MTHTSEHRFFRVIAFLFFCLPLLVHAQGGSGDYVDDYRMHYDDHVYRSNIKTVQIHQTTWAFSPPVIKLNSGQQLMLSFDDLNGENQSYYYTFIHCDADWKPSDIDKYDYIKGFGQDLITNYAYSFNTYQPYTHYWVNIPNNNMQLLYSGNYIVKVYINNNPDSLVLTRRFMVYEDLVTIHARVKQALGEDSYTKQEVNFSINTSRYPIQDPFHAMKTVIMQNGRWDNAITDLQPQFVQDTALQYFQDDGNAFDGGNVFRSFDMTSLHYNTEHIEGQVPNPNSYEIQLTKDVPRPTSPYFYFQDIHGQYLIKTKDADSSTINSEYVWVDFFMPMDSAFTKGNLYIFGQLSDWQCKKEFEMHYDNVTGGYRARVYLKQGYYEYEYAFLKDGSNTPNTSMIEGSHYETVNQYYILVYNREPGLYYDKLVGYDSFNSLGH